MSLDPLVTIILLIYFATVIIVLIVWLVITANSTTSLPLPKVKSLANLKAKAASRFLQKGARANSTKSSQGNDSYRHRRQHSFSRTGNSRISSRRFHSEPEPLRLSSKQRSNYSSRKNYDGFDDRLIEKNLHTKPSSKLSNDDFRGAKAKKQHMPIDINVFEDFAKNKK